MDPSFKEILINDNSLVSDIQLAFSVFYPYLKIEFLKASKEIVNSKKNTVDPVDYFRQLTSQRLPKKLNLANERTISEVKNDINAMFGLEIKVFRKSGNTWNVISLTNSWTLENQNKAAQFICGEMAAM